jgi:2-amino-1-hydroxyethylphosphonate dioxygenase (glycine-forming)
MTETEAKVFEADENHPLILKMREWDEKAKVKDMPLPDLQMYKSMALDLLK